MTVAPSQLGCPPARPPLPNTEREPHLRLTNSSHAHTTSLTTKELGPDTPSTTLPTLMPSRTWLTPALRLLEVTLIPCLSVVLEPSNPAAGTITEEGDEKISLHFKATTISPPLAARRIATIISNRQVRLYLIFISVNLFSFCLFLSW